jgi:hypothetical protein
MALTKSTTLIDNFGHSIEFSECYIRVFEVNGGKEMISASVSWHPGAGQRSLQVRSFQFVPDMDGPNFIRQAYLHLKTLPEFANAVDC